MKIETDDEFVALMRERFASRPYSNASLGRECEEEYWTPARYGELIAKLLTTQREIRAASAEPPLDSGDPSSSDAFDAITLRWAIWSIQTHDVGAMPTHWHRVWSAIQSVISSTRHDERHRIAAALRDDNAASIGRVAAELIASAITQDCD